MTIKNFSDLEPERIVWEDISQCDQTWASAEDIHAWLGDVADAHVEQIGYVLGENDKYVIITDSVIESDELYGNVCKIPKSVILKRVKLIEDDKGTGVHSE